MQALRSFALQILMITLVVGTITFIFTHALGDLDYRIAAGRYGYDMVDSEAAELVRKELGLDRPVLTSYLHWLKDLATWNLGVSLVSGTEITTLIKHEVGNTVLLALAAVALSLVMGPTMGIAVALSRNKMLENISIALAVGMRSLPAYVVGIILIIVFSVYFDILPAAGNQELVHYVLPALTLAIPLAAVSCRITSETLTSVMQSDYYEFARLKGLSQRQAFLRHGIKNMAIPVIAFHGVQLVYLIEGLVVVETLFAWPGIGHSMVHAVVARDIPMIQGTAMAMAFMFVTLNTLLDLLYRRIDPREAIQ